MFQVLGQNLLIQLNTGAQMVFEVHWLLHLYRAQRLGEQFCQWDVRCALGKVRLGLSDILDDVHDVLLALVLVSLQFWALLQVH